MGSTRLRNFNYSRNTVAKTFKNNLFAEEIRNLLTSTYVNMEWKPLIQNDDWNCTNLKVPLLPLDFFLQRKVMSLYLPTWVFRGPQTLHHSTHPLSKSPSIIQPTNLYTHLFANRLRKNQPPERSTWNLEGKLRQGGRCWCVEGNLWIEDVEQS